MTDIQTIAQGDGSHLVEPRRFVVRDPQAFAAVWAGHAGPAATPPAIDFDARMVVAVFAGHRPTPGYEIAIAGARRERDGLVIVVNEREPDASLATAQVLVSPFHIVSMPRDDGDVRFNTPDPTGQGTIIFKPSKSRVPSSAAEFPRRSQHATAAGGATGLTPEVAALLAYLAGPFSGALLLAIERSDAFVRFHAWQSVLALGVLGAAAVVCLILAFAMLIISPTAFWIMLWLSALAAGAWLMVWGVCLVQAYQGRRWKLPLVGEFAERKATSVPAS